MVNKIEEGKKLEEIVNGFKGKKNLFRCEISLRNIIK